MGRPVNYEVWEKRPKSLLIKELMEHSGCSASDFSETLGYSERYFNLKLARESFSFEDILALLYASNLTMFLVNNDDGSTWKMISSKEWCPEETKRFDELQNLKQKQVYEKKHSEYEKLKTELETMKKLYGFED